MVTLNVNPENVCRLIALAREFHAQEQVIIPDDPGSPADDWPTQILAQHADDLTLAEFRSIIEDLEPAQQVEVVTLLWLGRGDASLEDWEETLEHARAEWTPRTADYLIAHPLLPYFLTEGLEMLGHRCD